jgi:hypothetical protein
MDYAYLLKKANFMNDRGEWKPGFFHGLPIPKKTAEENVYSHNQALFALALKSSFDKY